MVLLENREDLLHALHSMGIELPPKTKMPMEDLDKKLRKALDLSQCIPTEYKANNSLNVSKLKNWSAVSSSSLLESIQTTSVDEASHNFLAMALTGSYPKHELFVDPFYDLRQTVMGPGKAYDANVKISLVKDKEEKHYIVLRVIEACAMDDNMPLLVVLYDDIPGPFDFTNSPYLLSHGENVNVCKSTLVEQSLLLKVLECNGKRMSRGYKPKRLTFEDHFKLSFILPFHPLNMIKVGSLTNDIGCPVCGEKSKSKCSQCYSVSYCGKECQRYDWPFHKKTCKSLAKGTWVDVHFHMLILFGAFNRRDNMMDLRAATNKLSAGTIQNKLGRDNPRFRGENDPECGPPPPNIHGDTAFLVKIQVPLNSDESDPDTSLLIYDRRRSFDAHVLRKLDPEKYGLIEYTVRNKGVNGMKMYRWARRTGDWQFSICLDREPEGEVKW